MKFLFASIRILDVVAVVWTVETLLCTLYVCLRVCMSVCECLVSVCLLLTHCFSPAQCLRYGPATDSFCILLYSTKFIKILEHTADQDSTYKSSARFYIVEMFYIVESESFLTAKKLNRIFRVMFLLELFSCFCTTLLDFLCQIFWSCLKRKFLS